MAETLTPEQHQAVSETSVTSLVSAMASQLFSQLSGSM